MTDASLRVPDLPSLSREMGSPRFLLRRTPPLDADPAFTIAGEHARVTGGHTRGVDLAWAAQLALLSQLRAEGARTVATTLTPVGLERDLELGTVTVVERVAVPRSGPVCFFEWMPAGDLSLPLTWRVQTTGRGSAGGPAASDTRVRWRLVERGLVVDFQGERALYVFSRAPTELVVTEAEPTGGGVGGPLEIEVRARLKVSGGVAVRLAVAGIGTGDHEARVLRVMDRTHVVVPTRRAEATRILDERLAVEAADEPLGEALAWAKIRLDAGEPGAAAPTPLSDRATRLVLASLAAGDPAPARSVCAGSAPANAGHDSFDTDPFDTARRLLVAGRYLAWTGDLVTVKGAWKSLRRRAESCLRAAGGVNDDHGLLTSALREMVIVAEESGDAELAGRLRSAVGGPGERVDMGWSPAAGDADVASDPLLRSATLVDAVVHGLLGVEPDAPRGRVVLRPRLPGSWTRFRVRNLAVGGAAMAMEYDASAGTHRFELRQERGAAPLTVILEPELKGGRLAAARVDGQPAGLEPVAADGRLRVPVQLVLDHERRLELEMQRADA